MIMQRKHSALYRGAMLAVLYAFSLLPHAAEHSVQLQGGDYLIPGILVTPDRVHSSNIKRAESELSVLLLHGTASQKDEVGDLFKTLAHSLEKQGIASLRIDFAGTGDSPVDYRRYSLSSARRDANTALEFLRKQYEPGARIAVLGFSQGGLIAQQLAIDNPNISALVTWSTAATNGKGSFGRFFAQYYDTAKRDGFASVSFPWLADPLNFDLQWFEEIAMHQTLTEVAVYKGPILAIAGSSDAVVPYQQSANLVIQSQHGDSNFVLIDGADHIFNVLEADPASPHPAALLRETVDWLSSRISN